MSVRGICGILTCLAPRPLTQLSGGFEDTTHFPGVGSWCWKDQSRRCFQIIMVMFDLPGDPLKDRCKGLMFISSNSELSLSEEVSTQEAFVKNV